MAKTDIRNYAIGTLTVALLISLGFVLQPDDNYICRSLLITKYCDHLSSTGKTCYPYAGNATGSKLCSEAWELIIQPLDDKITDIPSISVEPERYLCDSRKCVPV